MKNTNKKTSHQLDGGEVMSPPATPLETSRTRAQ